MENAVYMPGKKDNGHELQKFCLGKTTTKKYIKTGRALELVAQKGSSLDRGKGGGNI